MFTETIIESATLLALALMVSLVYWQLLGRLWDQRIFLAFNLALISIWLGLGQASFLLGLAVTAYIVLFMGGYLFSTGTGTLPKQADQALEFDGSLLLLVTALAQCYSNISSGHTTLDEKATVLAELADSNSSRYTTYILYLNVWLSVHTICRAARQHRWSRTQVLAIIATGISLFTSLSKASFLPLLLALLFAYRSRISTLTFIAILLAGFTLAVVTAQRLFPDLTALDTAKIIFERIIRNVDVLDYIDALGQQVFAYPHQSPFYLAWPLFQLSQADFSVPGVWLHGTTYGDWRGFGPNPTFIGDQIIAAYGSGLLFAPLLGAALRAADQSKYRILMSLIVYNLMQDWYFACLQLAIFIASALILKVITRGRKLFIN